MLHTWLYDKYGAARGPHRCYWQSLLPTERVVDWFEWQAGYASGALLMPESFARRTVEAYFQNRSERPPVAKARQKHQCSASVFPSRSMYPWKPPPCGSPSSAV